MIQIIKAGGNDAYLVSGIARLSFIESHGKSAGAEDINSYMNEKYMEAVLKEELRNPANIYYILYYNDRAAGYSKIIFNSPYKGSKETNIAKLERLYLLKEFYDLNLGLKLFEFNINLAKENSQSAIWLFVWKKNERAVNFYKKNGFVIIGSYDFPISKTHSNPNHQMLLSFQYSW